MTWCEVKPCEREAASGFGGMKVMGDPDQGGLKRMVEIEILLG